MLVSGLCLSSIKGQKLWNNFYLINRQFRSWVYQQQWIFQHLFCPLHFWKIRDISGNMPFVMSLKDMATGKKIINVVMLLKNNLAISCPNKRFIWINIPGFDKAWVLNEGNWAASVSRDLAAGSGSDTRASSLPCCDPTAGKRLTRGRRRATLRIRLWVWINTRLKSEKRKRPVWKWQSEKSGKVCLATERRMMITTFKRHMTDNGDNHLTLW